MNKQLHRVIFSLTKGQVIVVAEIAATHRKGTTGKSGKRRAALGFTIRSLRLAVLSILGMTATPLLASGIVADSTAPTNQQADILSSANGTPLINIQKPSQSGVSRNVYSQFDVHARGAILNNATDNIQTQIGGWIEGNARLQGKHARIILNEVNASDPSLLNGYIEVAGKRAEVVIANPAGIQVNGGGFINASRATLTTGTPQLAGGELLGYTIEQGVIHIGGNGLDASHTDYTAILARAVAVNAGIWADELNIATGANQINTDHSQITPLDADTLDFSLALDVAHLGGMYAGKITLIGTEHGMGVRNAGGIAAMQGKLVLDVNGMLVNVGELAASERTAVTVAALHNQGLLDGRETRIDADTLDNIGQGRIYGDHLAIQAEELNNLTNEESAAVIAARERLDLAVETLTNADESLIVSLGSLYIGGRLNEQDHADGLAVMLNNAGASIESMGDIHIQAQFLQNANPYFDKGMSLTSGHEYRDWHSDNYQYQTTRTTHRASVIASIPGEIFAGRDLAIRGEELVNDKSRILAGGLLDIQVNTLHNVEATGLEVIAESGRTRNRRRTCDLRILGQCLMSSWTWSSWRPYNPADVVTTFNLDITRLAGDSGGHNSTPTLPGNGLFQLYAHNPNAPLFETDPRFADYRTWLSSDYMMSALGLDPTDSLRRLGDGFYEQRFIREQIIEQTGQRHLAGFDNDQAQFLALMNRGLSQAEALQLRPGIALSAAQTAQLTSDMIWLVEETITLPDGRAAQALVPRVYSLPREGDLQDTGSLMAGQHLLLAIQDTLHNSGTLAAQGVLQAQAQHIDNHAGHIQANDMALRAEEDILNTGGSLMAKDSLVLDAGRNIVMTTTTQSDSNRHGASHYSRTNIDRLASVYVSQPSAILALQAGQDIQLSAAQITHDGPQGQTLLQAGRDIQLDTVSTAWQNDTVFNANIYTRHGERRDIGARLHSAGDIRLQASGDLTATAAHLFSDTGSLSAQAGGATHLLAGEAMQMSDITYQDKSYRLFSTRTTATRQGHHDIQALGSTLSADTIHLESGADMHIQGSQVVASHDVHLRSDGDIHLAAAHQSRQDYYQRSVRESGLFSSGGLSLTLGSREQRTEQQAEAQLTAASTVGSIDGNLHIQVDGRYHQHPSHLLTPRGDIHVQAGEIVIDAAHDAHQHEQHTRFRQQSGLTLALTSPVIDALETGQRMQRAAQDTDDSRMQALALASTALSAYGAYNSYQQAPAQGGGGLNISLTIGASRSDSHTTQIAQLAQASTLTAGGDITLQASGSEQGDIAIIGSQLSAGNKLHLHADKDIHLLAAQNIAAQKSHNNSSSASIGIGFSLGGQSNGFTLNLGVSQGRGHADGLDIQHSNTRLSAGDTLTLSVGQDTILRGAVAEAERIRVSTGGDLTIESLQDSSYFDSKQQHSSAGVSLCIPPFCYGTSSASYSASNSQAHGNFASVAEQSGIRAGDGGFDITVGGHTTLKGGLITSIAAPEHNRLVTATLTTEDLANHAEASASATGFSLGSDMLTQGKYAAAKALIANTALNAERSGSDSGQTLSAIAAGEITISDSEKQQQLTGYDAEETVALLNRNTDTAHAAAQRQDAEDIQRQVEAEQTIQTEAVRQLTLVGDKVYRKETEQKKTLLLQCETADKERCGFSEVVSLEQVRAVNGVITAFNNGMLNTEEQALITAYMQSNGMELQNGVLVIVNPRIDNIVAEGAWVVWKKVQEVFGFGSSSVGELNLALEIVAASQGAKLDTNAHSAGNFGVAEMNRRLEESGRTDAAIGTQTMFGSPVNAQQQADRVDTISGGQGSVQQATHVNDFVGTLFGGNPPTGGNPQTGALPSHSAYTGDLTTSTSIESQLPLPNAGTPEEIRERTDGAWAHGQFSQPVPVKPNHNSGALPLGEKR